MQGTAGSRGTRRDSLVGPSRSSPSIHEPESTYDVFRQVPSTAPLEVQRSSQLLGLVDVKITEEATRLLDMFQKGIGMWNDVFDHAQTYQLQVVRYAVSSPLILHSLCALSAKQMSLIAEAFLWEPVASRHYGESVALLIKELTEQQTSREVIICATSLLCSYELLAFPGADYERHLYGLCSLFQTHDIAINGTQLEHASFWVFARQSVGMAIAHECPTLIPPQKWPNVPRLKEGEEDKWARRILWLLAKMMNFRFSAGEAAWSHKRARDFRDLAADIDLWWESLPPSARGVVVKKDEFAHGVSRTWFYCSSAGKLH